MQLARLLLMLQRKKASANEVREAGESLHSFRVY